MARCFLRLTFNNFSSLWFFFEDLFLGVGLQDLYGFLHSRKCHFAEVAFSYRVEFFNTAAASRSFLA